MTSKSRHPSMSSRTRLGAIDEDGDMHPDVEDEQPITPPRAHGRTISRLLPFDFPPRASQDRAPPPYSQWDGVKGTDGGDLSALRSRNRRSTRGGWKTILLIVIVGALVIVALAVGLVLGLRHKSHDNAASVLTTISTFTDTNLSSSSTPEPSNVTEPFPIGSYSFSTFLSPPQTACTSNPSTWQCFPYVSYNESNTASLALFNWIIAPSSPGVNGSSLLISSTQNPFAITFTNATLSMTNSGLDNEAYTFSISLDKDVVPTTALTSDGAASLCMYNATTFTGTLFTRMNNTYPTAGQQSSKSAPSYFKPWPYAVQISQSIQGGMSVPDCYKTENGNLGEHIDLATESAQDVCSCDWQNFGA